EMVGQPGQQVASLSFQTNIITIRMLQPSRAANTCAIFSNWFDLAALTVVAVALGVAYTCTLAPGITWANDGSDSGDLVTAAATLGVAHPTGYPTYLLLARLFQLVPLGDLAFRATICSAAAAIGATLTVALIVRSLCTDSAWRGALSAGLAA